MPGDRELPLIQSLQVTLYVEHWISFESFHWLTIYWVRMMADFELVFQNWGLDLVPSRMMGDLGSAIRRNFLHFWPSYVSNIYFANETLSITAFSVTENVTFSKEKTIMEINRRFWPSRVKFCIFPCDVLPFPRTEDRQYFYFRETRIRCFQSPTCPDKLNTHLDTHSFCSFLYESVWVILTSDRPYTVQWAPSFQHKL